MNDLISVYKVRDKETGLFSSGGMNPKFKKGGHTWANLAHVRAHIMGIRQAQQYVVTTNQKSNPLINMRNWEIVEFKFCKIVENTIPIEQIIITSGMF